MISREAHLKIAMALWAMVGVGLFMTGLFFLFPEGGEPLSLIVLSVGLVLGGIKGRFVLPKVGKRNKDRILTLPEPSPFYMTFNAKSWLLVLSMILLGRIIRLAGTPPVIVGGIYVAVGIALLLGSASYRQS